MEPSTRIARKLAALQAMGFQRVDAHPPPTESVPVAGNRHKVTLTSPSMGTLVSMTAIHPSRDLAEEAMGRALSEMSRVVDLLNRYDAASAIWALNDLGRIQGPPPELSTVLGAALRYHGVTLGAFDPTVQPLVDLFRERRSQGTGDGALGQEGTAGNLPFPARAEVRELLELVDAGAVEISPRAIRLGKEGMGITLDGIAKGYVVDRVVDTLRKQGLTDFLVNAGGDIRSEGCREDGRPWRVAVQDPGKSGAFPDVITLSGMAVATSGSYEIYLDPAQTHHHILDSRDGHSPRGSRSVSIVAPTAMEADALATSVFLMEPHQGTAFIDSIPECACLIVDRQGRQVRSARWRSAADSPSTKAGTL